MFCFNQAKNLIEKGTEQELAGFPGGIGVGCRDFVHGGQKVMEGIFAAVQMKNRGCIGREYDVGREPGNLYVCGAAEVDQSEVVKMQRVGIVDDHISLFYSILFAAHCTNTFPSRKYRNSTVSAWECKMRGGGVGI